LSKVWDPSASEALGRIDPRQRSEGIYSEEHFSYDPLSNTYRCPANQVMRPRRLHPQRLSWEYVTAKGTCLACKLRHFCTRSRSGRTIHRHRDQELLDKARKIANSIAAKRDLKRRQHLMERSFADAANCHGLKRSRWRGLWRQAIQDLLIATVQNLRKLLRHLSQTHRVRHVVAAAQRRSRPMFPMMN
jgi:Transposase DDE domain